METSPCRDLGIIPRPCQPQLGISAFQTQASDWPIGLGLRVNGSQGSSPSPEAFIGPARIYILFWQ